MIQNNDRVKVIDNRFRDKPELSRVGQFGTVLDAPAFALQALVQLDSGEYEYFWPSELEKVQNDSSK